MVLAVYETLHLFKRRNLEVAVSTRAKGLVENIRDLSPISILIASHLVVWAEWRVARKRDRKRLSKGEGWLEARIEP
jgi:predicted small integral membrane protein